MKKLILATLFMLSLFRTTAKDNGLLFIENVGQYTDQFHTPRTDIDFGLRAGGMNIFIEAGAIHYQFMKAKPQDIKDIVLDPLHGMVSGGPQVFDIHRVDMELLGANKNVKPTKEGRLQYYERYYTPQFGEDGGKALAYSKIVYKDIYPHIDWVLYINGEQVEYDFIVRDGGDPANIRLRYNGVDSLNLDPQGNLIVTTSHGNITEHAPVGWQEDGRRVAASFKLKGDILSFDVAAYEGTLLIDPYLEWATYYGGNSPESGPSITEDELGNIFISGKTQSGNNIATIGAYDVNYADHGDIYIAKFTGNGSRLWGTYFGGMGTDNGGFIVYDRGYLFITGSTDNATGMATIGCDQPVSNGPNVGDGIQAGEAFITKFDASGNRVWCTYFGGNDIDGSTGIICDTAGNVYMTGTTYSTSNIATIGAHQTNKTGNWNTKDGFLAKYDAAGHKLWSTYYGGSEDDGILDITVSQDNIVYFCGYTNSISNISTPGCFQEILSSTTNGFIAAFDQNGSRLWGTYYGGNTSTSITEFWRMSCTDGNVFITGRTNDPSGITTNGCYQPVYGGNAGGDIIIAKFDNLGSRVWSTYLGGSGYEIGLGMDCSPSGDLYITGATTSPDNIAINAFQGNYIGGPNNMDALLAKFNNGGNCIWSTYLGGSEDDVLYEVKASGNNIYVSGQGASLPTTSGSHQPNFAGGNNDGYLAKLYDFPTGIIFEPNCVQVDIQLSPNPNNGSFVITGFVGTNESEAVITISNIIGQTICSERVGNIEGHFSKFITLDHSAAPGVYILNFISGNRSLTKRLVKN